MASLSAVSFLRLSSNLLFRRWCSSFGRGDPTKNYYNILDVDPKADDKEIKSAFYAQSKKLHPDVSPEDSKAPDKFKELVEAYEVLSDSKKRQTYDDALGTTKKEPTFHSDDDDDCDEDVWHLGQMRYVSLEQYGWPLSDTYVDIRQYFINGQNECYPTKKGIMLTFEQFDRLKEFRERIDFAIKKNVHVKRHLGKMKFVQVKQFKGRIYVGIRKFENDDYDEDNRFCAFDDSYPTKKGIMLTIEQYERLNEVIPEIDQEISEMYSIY